MTRTTEQQKRENKFTLQDLNAAWNYKDSEFVHKPKPFEIRKNPKPDANCTISIYGKRKTGKSIFCKWYLKNHADVYPWGWVFTKTRNNKFWESFVPRKKILGEYTPFNLNRIMQRQKEMQSMYIKGMDVNPLAFVVWDDALGNEIKYDDTLATYYFNSRHFSTLNLMTSQHITATPPPIRQNTDHAIIFKNYNGQAIDHLVGDFSRNKDKDAFIKLMDTYTNDNNFLHINNDPSVKDEDYMTTGKADVITEPFVLGCHQYWRGHPDQLEEIFSGKLQKQQDRLKEITDVDKIVKLFDVSKPGRQDDRV